MFAKDIEEFYMKVSAMSPELQTVVEKYWDSTGRTNNEHVFTSVAKDLLEKNQATGFTQFLADMETIFPEIEKEVAHAIYSAFLHGARCLSQQLTKRIT